MGNAGAQVPGSSPDSETAADLAGARPGRQQSGPGQRRQPAGAIAAGPAGTGASIWSGNSQTFLQGGIDRSLPDMPNYDAFAPGAVGAIGPADLPRRGARCGRRSTIYWIGSVQCTMKGGDNQTLAYQLGQLIGGAIGQRRSRVAM